MSPHRTLAAALLGFFIITLDALVVSVALPAIRESLGGGITGLQWVMDGYTLPFAALLLFAGSLADRLGARRVFAFGLAAFVVSSAACAFGPTLAWLVVARGLQGLGAACMTPASLALLGEAYPEPAAKARAVGVWAVGGAVASAAGPLVGGALTTLGWELIFLVNLPVGALAAWLLRGVPASPRREVSFDWAGQGIALLALCALVFGLIEAGELGLNDVRVWTALGLAAASIAAFVVVERVAKAPMVPRSLFRLPAVRTPIAIGFTFMIAFYGMVFAMSLWFQTERGFSPVETGLAFVPVTGTSIFAPLLAARLAERFGAWLPIVLGQASMALGAFGLAFGLQSDTATVIGAMTLVGFGGGTAMPSATSALLNAAPVSLAGTASGVLNTSRQVGGALAIAVFGALLASLGFDVGVRVSLGLGGVAVSSTLVASFGLRDGSLAPERAAPITGEST